MGSLVESLVRRGFRPAAPDLAVSMSMQLLGTTPFRRSQYHVKRTSWPGDRGRNVEESPDSTEHGGG